MGKNRETEYCIEDAFWHSHIQVYKYKYVLILQSFVSHKTEIYQSIWEYSIINIFSLRMRMFANIL